MNSYHIDELLPKLIILMSENEFSSKWYMSLAMKKFQLRNDFLSQWRTFILEMIFHQFNFFNEDNYGNDGCWNFNQKDKSLSQWWAYIKMIYTQPSSASASLWNSPIFLSRIFPLIILLELFCPCRMHKVRII